MVNKELPYNKTFLIFHFRNGREARNRAEKHRRDKLNGSIQELSTMVPHVAESPRRVDKTAVLRFSAHGLRIDYGEFISKVTTRDLFNRRIKFRFLTIYDNVAFK